MGQGEQNRVRGGKTGWLWGKKEGESGLVWGGLCSGGAHQILTPFLDLIHHYLSIWTYASDSLGCGGASG